MSSPATTFSHTRFNRSSEVLPIYNRRLHRLRDRACDRRAARHVAPMDRLLVPVSHTIVHLRVIGFLAARSTRHNIRRGRRLPLLHGMATGADGMSAASFIGMAARSTFPATTGCPSSWAGPVATCVRAVPRAIPAQFGQFTSPTSSARAMAQHWRSIASFAILCSFTYVVAQI